MISLQQEAFLLIFQQLNHQSPSPPGEAWVDENTEAWVDENAEPWTT